MHSLATAFSRFSFTPRPLCAALLTATLAACGVGNGAAIATTDASARAETCGPFQDAGEPDVPTYVIPAGGIPIEERNHALAVARCGYWARCSSGMAPYALASCITAMETNFGWQFPAGGGGGSAESEAMNYPIPNPALLAAVDAGTVLYDPLAEATCIAFLLAQACTYDQTAEGAAPCQGVFSCADAAIEGDAGGDAAGSDAGSACAALIPTFYGLCETDQDCPATADGGPAYCVSNNCTESPCGRSPLQINCSNFVPEGSPCDSSPPLMDMSASLSGALEDAAVPEMMCAYGLTCRGLGGGGGFGTCTTAVDVGGACDETAVVPGCLFGLACVCGVCQILPESGHCTSTDECDFGTSFCDLVTTTCRPFLQTGEPCTATLNGCAPGLSCLCVPSEIFPPAEDGGQEGFVCSGFVCGPAQDRFADAG